MKKAPWIKGFEGKYKILPNGDIYSFVRSEKGKLLSPRLSGSGYLMVTLSGKQFYVHVLNAQQFLINPNEKKFKMVIFKNGNPLNVRISNLLWSDSAGRGNQRSINERKSLKSEGMVNSLISEEQLLDIARLIKKTNSRNKQETIAKLFGIHRITLYRIRKTPQFIKALQKV